jgi:hypothetical protein
MYSRINIYNAEKVEKNYNEHSKNVDPPMLICYFLIGVVSNVIIL